MIIELTKKNLSEIDNSFIDKKMFEHELSTNPFAKILILKEDNQVIGFLYYSDIYERVEINQFEIENIHRSCGKGTILLQKLIDLVDKDISLEVRIHNKPAIKLYQKFNFKAQAIRPGYYNGIDGILMERKNKNSSQ